MDTGALSPGVKLPGCEADHSPPTSAEVKKSESVHPLPHLSSWHHDLHAFFFKFWFVRLLALRPLLAYCASLGDSEDDCGEADGM
jgi:hypothetical protein